MYPRPASAFTSPAGSRSATPAPSESGSQDGEDEEDEEDVEYRLNDKEETK